MNLRPIVVTFMLVAVVGCSLLKKKEEDAGAPEEPKTAVVEAGPADAGGPTLAAKNAADIVRFPSGEVAMSDLAAKTTAIVIAKTGCKSGNAVGTLPKGTDVAEVAAYDDCYLVTFLDPKAPADRVAGWITKDAFGTPTAIVAVVKDAGVVDAGKPVLKCVAPQIAVAMGGDPVCHKKCTTDADCSAVKGACVVGAAATVGGKAVHVCNNQ